MGNQVKVVEPESKFDSNNTAIVYNKYACDVLEQFNDRHRTKFSCSFGSWKEKYATAELDESRHCIRITLPNFLLDATDHNMIEAGKIMIGHELAHHLYANMTIKRFEAIAMVANAIAGKYRRVIGSCSIETAADIAGEKFYIDQGGKMTDAIYENYKKILEGGEKESPAKIKSCIQMGYLPPSYRVKIMKTYKSFKGNNFEVLSQICDDLDFIGSKYLGKDLRCQRWFSWMKDQFELMNFPNRPNRIR